MLPIYSLATSSLAGSVTNDYEIKKARDTILLHGSLGKYRKQTFRENVFVPVVLVSSLLLNLKEFFQWQQSHDI